MGKTSSIPQTTTTTGTSIPNQTNPNAQAWGDALANSALGLLSGQNSPTSYQQTGNTSNVYGTKLYDTAATKAASQLLQSTLGGNYLNSDPSMSGYQSFAQGNNPAMGYLMNYANQDPTQSAWYNTMAPTTSVLNPFLGQAFNQAAGQVGQQYSNQVLPGIASQFSLAGRTGSGAQQEALNNATQQYGNTLSQLGTSMYLPAYENAMGRQAQLAQMLQGNEAQQLGAAGNYANLQLAGLSGLSSPYQAERSRQMQALGLTPSIEGSYNTNQGYNYGIMPSQQAQALQYASSALLPLYAAGMGSDTSQTQTNQLYQNKNAGLLGGAATGAGIGTQIMPGVGTAVGAGIGGILGYL